MSSSWGFKTQAVVLLASIIAVGGLVKLAIRNRRQALIAKLKLILTDDVKSLYTRYVGTHLTDEELIARIMYVHQEAMKKFPYRTISEFRFVESRLASHFRYQQILAELTADTTLRYLDIGCSIGTDVRQLLVDGVRPSQVLGVDIDQKYLDLGYYLFEDEKKLSDRFTCVNILDKEQALSNPQLQQHLIRDGGGGGGGGVEGRLHQKGVHVIYTGSVYHLLTEQQCIDFTRALYDLIQPGGRLIGRTVGTETPYDYGGGFRYLHSSSSFNKLLQDAGFIEIEVREHSYEAVLRYKAAARRLKHREAKEKQDKLERQSQRPDEAAEVEEEEKRKQQEQRDRDHQRQQQQRQHLPKKFLEMRFFGFSARKPEHVPSLSTTGA